MNVCRAIRRGPESLDVSDGHKKEIADSGYRRHSNSRRSRRKPGSARIPEDLFVHSTIFVVVDKQARLRGEFETGGEGIEWTDVKRRILTVVRRVSERER